MKLFHDLFFTDYGLMSFIGIMFMLGMGVFFCVYFYRVVHPNPKQKCIHLLHADAFRRNSKLSRFEFDIAAQLYQGAL